MAVEIDTSRVSYTGAGTTGPFTIPFYFISNEDIRAVTVLIADGTETELAYSTDFTLTGAGDEEGGELTLIATLSSSYNLVIFRDPEILQEARFPRNDPFPAATNERVVDLLTMIAQRNRSLLDRSLRQPDGDTTDIAQLPAKVVRATNYMAFDADGDPIATSGTDGVPASTFMETVLDDTTSNAVLTTLTHTRSESGAAERTLISIFRSRVSIEDFGGGPDKTATVNSAALDAAIDALGANGGDILLEAADEYDFNAQCDLPRDVNLIGHHTPGADPSDAPTGTRIKRVADVILFNMVGTNRSTDRVGRNLFRGIQFIDDANVSSNDFFNCKYADSVVFENCTFWQPDGQTTAGHYIDVEECWDWRFWNVIFKHYGNAAGSKHAINIYNGANDNSNGWMFYACRWQEGMGSALNFDSTGLGSVNHTFNFYGCKAEDTGNAAKSHITGRANDLLWSGGELAGCGERQVSQPSNASRWSIESALIANGGNTATEMIELLGNRSRVAGCTFTTPGSAVVQYINTTGAECDITGNRRASTALPLVNASSVAVTTKIHENPDFLTEYSSTAQITSGNTSVTVTHGLGYTPLNHHIMVCPHASLASATRFWVANVGATTFDIVVNADPTATVTFVWWARRQRG